MTNFNFLSKSSSQSRSHRVVTLASTVGSPSAHRRGTMLKPLFLAMFFLLAGVGNVWGVDPDHSASETFPFTTSGCSGWTGSNCGSYCSAYGKSSGTPTISKAEIANFQAVDFDLHENVSLTIKVKGGNNGGTQTCTVTLIDKNGNKVSDYSQQQSEAYNGSTKNSAKTITFTFNPTQAFSGYKVSKPAKGWYVETSYTLTYDDKAPSVPYTVTLMDDNSELEESSAGAGVTLPSRTGCTGYTFAGWTTSWTEEQDEWTTTEPTIIEAGSYSPNADEYLYPVYTKTEGGGTTYQFQKVTALSQIKAGGTFIITNGSYYLPNGAATNAGPAVASMVTVTNGVVTGTVTDAMKWTFSAADANNRTTIKSVANSNNYLYTVSDGNGVRVSTTSDSWTFEEYTVSSILGFAMKSTSQNRYCAVYSTSNWRSYTTKNAANYSQNSGRLDIYKYTEVSSSTTSYISAPNCCSPLGSINGSFSFTNVSPTSVTVGVPSDYEDKDDSNLTGYIFKRYAASTGGDALETIETNSASGTSATFNTNLVANTTYYYTITAKHESSSCNSAETSPRKSYKIDSYVVSYANGGGSGTNPGAHDPVLANGKVTLKSNTFDAPTGKEFRVWNDGTSDLDEGEEYTVTANTVMTAQWQCMEPGFTKNLSTTQVNYLQGETAAKLSVTAAANGAELSYAWEMSANGTTGWSSVGTNSNEYTPSTATAGDQYYHCIVTNLADGCTESKATSAVAHIHVDVPAACLEPVISVASDTYYEDKSVTITCGTVGAAIYYTTDGSTTPTSGSTLYEGAITVDHSMTIKAIAIKAGMDNSTVAEATYTIKCETPTIVLAAGNYTGVQTTTITKGYGTKIYYTTDGTTPSNTNGTEYTGAVSIDQPMTLKAIVWKDGCTNSEVASAAYTLKCTTPEFNKGTDTYTGAQSITLSGTAGADIYYTLDGTTPSKTNGTKYTAAIEVSANQTVKAIAVKEGWGDSEIASATYTIQYNVYWWVNGVAWTEKGGSTLVTYGQTATAPTTAPTKADGCGDKFMGWTETQNYENDNTAPMDMFTETSAAITGETNFYAVFADYGEDE